MVPSLRSKDEIVSLPAGQSLRVTPEHKVTSVPYTNCFKIKDFSTFYDGCPIVIDCCPVHQGFWKLAYATINPSFHFLQRLKEIIAKSNVICDAILFSSSRICGETFKKLLLISKITIVFTEINAHEYMCYSP